MDEPIPRTDADGFFIDPVLDNELDRVVNQCGEDQYATGTTDRKVTRRRVDTGDNVTPLGTGSCTHLLNHLKTFFTGRLKPVPNGGDLVEVGERFHRLFFFGRARHDAVVAHDLGIGPQEKGSILEEFFDQLLILQS